MFGFLRLLLFLLATWLLWKLVMVAIKAVRGEPPPEPPAGEFEKMAPCAQCGTYLPTARLSGDPPRCANCRGE